MALRSSRTSFSSSLIRCASSVVVPGLRPPSTWAFLTQVRMSLGMDAQLVGNPADRTLGPRRIGQRLQRPSSWPARAAHRDTSLSPMTVILPFHHCLHQTQGDSSTRTPSPVSRRRSRPGSRRTPSDQHYGHTARLIPGHFQPPVLMPSKHFNASTAVHSRSSSRTPPDTHPRTPFSLNAHHYGLHPTQH